MRQPGSATDPVQIESDRLFKNGIVCLILVSLIWLIFGQTLGHGFVNFDDGDYVYNNLEVARGLSIPGIGWAFTHVHSGNWHPLTTLSHMLDCELFGLHPRGHHFVNVVLHIAVAILLFLTLQQMTAAPWPSALVAMLFAIHPLRVESVAWVSERKDMLSGIFFMATLWVYTRYARSKGSGSRPYLLALVLFALGLMCKPTLVTLPFVLLLLDYWPLQRLANSTSKQTDFSVLRRLVIEKIPFFILSAASCVATLLAQKQAIDVLKHLSFFDRIGNALVSYVIYLRQMVYPVGLAVLYPHPAHTLSTAEVLFAFIFLAAVSLVVILWRKKHPYLLIGWLWYLGMLVPMIGIVQVGLQARADRYTYLPQIGIALAVVWSGNALFSSSPLRRRLLIAFASIVIAALGLIAFRQTAYWRNSETLWQHTLSCTSNNFLAHDDCGSALLEEGRTDEAISEFEAALAINPNSAETHNNLSAAFMRNRRIDDAIAHYMKAIEIKPDYAEAHSNLGVALMQKKRFDEAVDHFRKALASDPKFAQAYNNFGASLLNQGKVDDAIDKFQRAIAIDPEYAEAQNNLGNSYLIKGRSPEALVHYEKARAIRTEFTRPGLLARVLRRNVPSDPVAEASKAVKLRPDSAETRCAFANALRRNGYLGEAIIRYTEALQLNPNLAETQNGLGNTLIQRGDLNSAITHYQKAIEINPRFADAHNNLGNALLQKGDVKEAIAHCEEAMQIKPSDASFQNNLAFVLATTPDASLRNGPRAIELARRANELSNWSQPDFLATLAAAFAETRRFPEAIETAQKAAQLAERQGNQPLARRIQTDIKVYRSGSPLRTQSLANTSPGNP